MQDNGSTYTITATDNSSTPTYVNLVFPDGTTGLYSSPVTKTKQTGTTFYQGVDFAGHKESWKSFSYSPQDQPDLTIVEPVVVSPTSVVPGGTIQVGWIEKNQGTAASTPAHHTRISLSTSPYGTTYQVGYYGPMSMLGIGATQPYSTSIVVPTSIPAGDYYVTAFIDCDQQVSEGNKNNNIGSSSPSKLTVGITPTTPAITSPAPGSTLSSSSVTFQWSSGSGVSDYFLYVGSSFGTNDIYGMDQGLNLSATINGLPQNGSTLYVRLWWQISGNWQYTDYTYTAFTQVMYTMTISDASVTEGNSGTTNCTFNVVLSQIASQNVTVQYATADGSATLVDNDYQSASGTLTISVGQTSGTITVKVVGDTKVESDEYFVVNLSNPNGATLLRSQGAGTILNDDQQAGIASTTTTLGVSASSIVYGQMLTFTAIVAVVPPDSGTPTGGAVTFMDGSTTLGTAPLIAGTATFTTTSLAVGPHLVTAIYSGDGLSFAGSSTTVTPTSIITTVAGNGTSGYGGDNGLATSAELNNPSPVAVDASGHLFIADEGNNRVRKIDLSTGVITTVAGNGTYGYSGDGGQASMASLAIPVGVAVDTSNNMFIADYGNHRVRKVDLSTAIITTIAGNGTWGFSGDGGQATLAKLSNPTGIAMDAQGNLFIADEGNNRIREVNLSTGVISTVAGNGTQGYSGDNGPATAASLNGPSGVAVDASGNLLIADFGDNRIRKVNLSTGVISTVAGNGTQGYSGDNGPATAASLNGPSGVAVDASGNILIADWGDNRIREVNHSTSVITTVAGGGVGGLGDGGPANSAQLNSPVGVAFDTSGNLFIGDQGNNRVRQVTPGVSVTVTYNPPDMQGPAITITSPLNNATVTSASLPVSGMASDNGYGNNGISSVTVNGVSASGGTVSGSGTANWNTTIMLIPGVNPIMVVAKDMLNNSNQQQITVTYTPPRSMTVDLNNDGIPNFYDFSVFAKFWQNASCSEPNWCNGSDFNKDGIVDIYDLQIFSEFWLWPVADIDMDERVDFVDYVLFSEKWKQTECKYPDWCNGCDFDKSGTVDMLDFAIFADYWLEGTSP
ncbi:MAG: Ig-like domain repeat protein [Sedimentisphaerales bacterium]